MWVNGLFVNNPIGKPKSKKKKIEGDVKIRAEKDNKGRYTGRIRFSFYNTGFDVLKNVKYVQVSDVGKEPGLVIFRFFDEKTYKKTYTVCGTKGAKKPYSVFFTMTPTAEQEKIFRSKWVNGAFTLYYNERHGLYFIELEES